jgi:hypothetical protein
LHELAEKEKAAPAHEIERIEDAVSHIRFPLAFSDQVYNLRSHIDIVRRRAHTLVRFTSESRH